MSNLFKSPSSSPTWTSPSGVDESREGLLNALNTRLAGNTLTQGPTSLQKTGASLLEGLMASNFGTGYQTGQRTLEEAANTGMPVSLDALKSLEQQRMQQLPYEMAGVTEQLTARGMGGDSDLARILGETAGRAQTDIAAAMAPYYYQGGESAANRRMLGAQSLLPYAQMPVSTGLGAVSAGGGMRETIDPVVQLLSQLGSQGALSQTMYGPSLGSQLLTAAVSSLPWSGLTKSLPFVQSLLKGGGQVSQTASDWLRSLGIGNQNTDVAMTPDNLSWLLEGGGSGGLFDSGISNALGGGSGNIFDLFAG